MLSLDIPLFLVVLPPIQLEAVSQFSLVNLGAVSYELCDWIIKLAPRALTNENFPI